MPALVQTIPTQTATGSCSLASRLVASSSKLPASDYSASSLRCPLRIAPRTPIRALPKAVMSLSLGKSATHHSFESKVSACRAMGYQGIEIHFEDIQNVAKSQAKSSPSDASPTHSQLLQAASYMRPLCDEAQIQIICLEPFLHYPGILPISRRDQRLRDEIPLWFTLSDILGTDVIQVASAMFSEGHTGDEARIVEDLSLLADLGLSWRGANGVGPLRPKFWAYEAMCFGAYTTHWEQAWNHVQLVNRPNFGLVVDTFQIAGASYADPSASDGSGKTLDAEQSFQRTITNLRSTFGGQSKQAQANRDKVFFVQLGDAAKMSNPPLNTEHPLFDAKQHANIKMAWARSCRLFQGEGYLPCNEIAQLFVGQCGWRGWLSAEYFNQDQVNDDARYPSQAAERCMKGHEGFLQYAESASEHITL